MGSRIQSLVEPRNGRYTGTIKDLNVKRLVQAWIRYTPANLDIPFEQFLLMPSREVDGFGPEFATKHRELIRRILIKYADSVNTINVMAEVGDTRHDSPLDRRHYNNQIDGVGADGADGYEHEDAERFYAQELDVGDELAAYLMELGLQQELNRDHPRQNIPHPGP